METHILRMITNNTQCKVLLSQEDIFMPKNKVQEVVFTGMMVLVMVYAMIC